MDVNEDFVDIAKGFIDNGVEFLIVGACALAAHGFPRTTGDIDMFVRPTPDNAARVFRALADFGAPVAAADAIEGKLGPVSVRFIGKAAMARNKLASGRPKDLVDAALLQSDE